MKYEVAIMVIGGLFMGCSLGDSSTHPVGSTTQPSSLHSGKNGLNFNSIVFNRGVFGHLSAQPIALGRNDKGELIFNSVEGIETTFEGRELLHYVAQCALESDDVLLAETGREQYRFPGLFALAPEWEYREISAAEEELISACLLAHVNAYGQSVHISVRSPGAIAADPMETESHPVYEGTFFGDVFKTRLKPYACTGSRRDIAVQHAPDRLMRSCTDASPDCQLAVVGRCRDVCDTYVEKYGWQGCWAGGHRYAETVSVFLHDANRDGLNRTCDTGDRCVFQAAQGDAVYDCSDAAQCVTTCRAGSYCTVHGSGAGRDFSLVRKSTSEINCQMAGRCGALCLKDSDCEIDCWRADSCRHNVCVNGAECLLDCTGSRDCGFALCEGGETTCANDVVVCNRPCP